MYLGMIFEKVNLKLTELERLVYRFRVAIEKACDEDLFVNDILFSRFPKGCCGDTSVLLGHYLLENGIETDYVCGTYYGEDAFDTQSHAWLKMGDIVIDVTGNQFQNDKAFLYFSEPVYIGIPGKFYNLFEVNQFRDVRKSCYIDELGEAAQPRLKSLYRTICKYL